MDKIFSARLNEAVIRAIGILARQLGTTKKEVVEGAIRLYTEKVRKEKDIDVLQQTCGAWNSKESPGKTVEKTRKTFRNSMHRHQQ